MFSNTLSFLSSRNVNNQVSHPYKTTGKIIVLTYIYISDSNKTDKPDTQLHGSTLYHHHRIHHSPDKFRGNIPIINTPVLKASIKLLTRIYKVNVHHTVLCYIAMEVVCNKSARTVVRTAGCPSVARC